MFWRQKYLLSILACLAVLAFIWGYSQSGGFFRGLPDKMIKSSPSPGSAYSLTEAAFGFRVNSNTGFMIDDEYTLCHHTVTRRLPQNPGFIGKDMQELASIYPKDEGWELNLEAGNTIRLRRQVASLCPVDEAKRHLSLINGYLAIYKGPAGINDSLIRITNISLHTLPPQTQDRIISGEMEFKDENELMQALDSFDEYTE